MQEELKIPTILSIMQQLVQILRNLSSLTHLMQRNRIRIKIPEKISASITSYEKSAGSNLRELLSLKEQLKKKLLEIEKEDLLSKKRSTRIKESQVLDKMRRNNLRQEIIINTKISCRRLHIVSQQKEKQKVTEIAKKIQQSGKPFKYLIWY